MHTWHSSCNSCYNCIIWLNSGQRSIIRSAGSGPIWALFHWMGLAILNLDPSPVFYLFIYFLHQSTICGRTQTRVQCYSGKPEDKISAVWKHFQLECGSSPVATCNFCNTTAAWRANKHTPLNTKNVIRHVKEPGLKTATWPKILQRR